MANGPRGWAGMASSSIAMSPIVCRENRAASQEGKARSKRIAKAFEPDKDHSWRTSGVVQKARQTWVLGVPQEVTE